MHRMQRSPLAFLLSLLLLSGCCWGIKCEPCFPAGLFISYVDSLGANPLYDLNENWVIREFDLDTQQELQVDRAFGYFELSSEEIYLPPEAGRYWTIVNDSLGVRDTVIIDMAELNEGGRHGCCYCGPNVDLLQGRFNGEAFSGEFYTRQL